MFRKKRGALERSLRTVGADLSKPLAKAILEMMIDNELSDYSLTLEVGKMDDDFTYNFDTEDLGEWVCSVLLETDGDCSIFVKGVNKSGNAPPWENIKIHSKHDLFGRPLDNV